MATRELPTFPSNLDHRYNVQLDGLTITFEWHYNRRADRWSIHLFDVDNIPIRHGVRLVTGIDLLQRVALATKPPGTLIVVDTTGADTEPDSDTLGNEARLRYAEA